MKSGRNHLERGRYRDPGRAPNHRRETMFSPRLAFSSPPRRRVFGGPFFDFGSRFLPTQPIGNVPHGVAGERAFRRRLPKFRVLSSLQLGGDAPQDGAERLECLDLHAQQHEVRTWKNPGSPIAEKFTENVA